MTITLTVIADTPAQIAAAWDALGAGPLEVEIVGDEMFLSVDLTAQDDPEAEPETQGEDTESSPWVVLPGAFYTVLDEPVEDTSTSTVEPPVPAPVDQAGDDECESSSPAEHDAAPAAENVGGEAGHGPRSCTPPATPPGLEPDTLRGRIVALLNTEPDAVFTPDQVLDRLGSSTIGSVRTTLLWLAREQHIDAVQQPATGGKGRPAASYKARTGATTATAMGDWLRTRITTALTEHGPLTATRLAELCDTQPDAMRIELARMTDAKLVRYGPQGYQLRNTHDLHTTRRQGAAAGLTQNGGLA